MSGPKEKLWLAAAVQSLERHHPLYIFLRKDINIFVTSSLYRGCCGGGDGEGLPVLSQRIAWIRERGVL